MRVIETQGGRSCKHSARVGTAFVLNHRDIPCAGRRQQLRQLPVKRLALAQAEPFRQFGIAGFRGPHDQYRHVEIVLDHRPDDDNLRAVVGDP